MFGINPFLLLFLPLIFQFIFGRKDNAESIKLNFAKVSIINFLLQIVFSCLVFNIIANRLTANGPLKCGMPFVGLIFLELLIGVFLLAVILIQYLIKRSYNRNT